MIRESYFMILVEVFRNHNLVEKTFHESYRVKKHKIIVFNPANKYQIIWQCHNFKNILIDISSNIHFFIKQKFCKNHFF